ncbi:MULTISPECIES: hypothetical protein [Nitrospirillum]|uniref:Uncharacterized protein n=1 Tax=Nitrospirillum amazonense TaxID=28077 RepID=A0A560G9J1_9PROT|nr:hypothetical protein [Nitrospirillum amazonense]MEC4591787.1 hypothetical protein [Nitrospirillum amazonense]TWB30464.1 hypothetical protein FBZ88_10227 [Nitrospirillum amazonense]
MGMAGGWARAHRVGMAAALLLLLSLPALSLPAAAQTATDTPATADSPPTVTITGNRFTVETLTRATEGFVLDHGHPSPRLNQLTRWERPVCPEAINVPADVAAFLTTRIRTVAAQVGAPTRDGCKRDIEIIFSDTPQAVMDAVADKRSFLLGYHFVNQTKALSKVTQAIQAWYVTAVRDGAVTVVDDPYYASGMHSDDPLKDQFHGNGGSRLSHDMASVFDNIVVIVDTTKIEGETFGSLADYLAMLVLAQPASAVGQCNPLPSILSLFSDACPSAQRVRSLSPADKAYLEGLYSVAPDAVGNLQRATIATHMLDSLKTSILAADGGTPAAK